MPQPTLDEKVIAAKAQLDNHNQDIKAAVQKKAELQKEIDDLENVVTEAVKASFAKKNQELENQKDEVAGKEKQVNDANEKLKADQEALLQGISEFNIKKKSLEGSIQDHQKNVDKNSRIKAQLYSLAKTIKDNLDIIEV